MGNKEVEQTDKYVEDAKKWEEERIEALGRDNSSIAAHLEINDDKFKETAKIMGEYVKALETKSGLIHAIHVDDRVPPLHKLALIFMTGEYIAERSNPLERIARMIDKK